MQLKYSTGMWCSGITSASHAEGPGFEPRRLQPFFAWHQLSAFMVNVLKVSNAKHVPLVLGNTILRGHTDLSIQK